ALTLGGALDLAWYLAGASPRRAMRASHGAGRRLACEHDKTDFTGADLSTSGAQAAEHRLLGASNRTSARPAFGAMQFLIAGRRTWSRPTFVADFGRPSNR